MLLDDGIGVFRKEAGKGSCFDIGGFEDHAVEIEHQDVWHDGHQAASAPVAFSA